MDFILAALFAVLDALNDERCCHLIKAQICQTTRPFLLIQPLKYYEFSFFHNWEFCSSRLEFFYLPLLEKLKTFVLNVLFNDLFLCRIKEPNQLRKHPDQEWSQERVLKLQISSEIELDWKGHCMSSLFHSLWRFPSIFLNSCTTDSDLSEARTFL